MRVGGYVQIVLLGLFTAAGLLGTVAVAVDWLQGVDTWSWEKSTCTIESSEAVHRPDLGEVELQVSYSYHYRSERYTGDAYRHGDEGFGEASEMRVLASRYVAGSEVSCWVDPDDPRRSYLRRASLWSGLWILIPLVFVAVGAGSLWLLYALRFRGDETEVTDRGLIPKTARAGVGRWALIVLFGVFLLFGTGFLIPFFVWPALQVVESSSWVTVPCRIESSAVRSHPGDDSTTYSVDVLFRYEIDGREYRSNRYQFLGGSSSGYDRKAKIVEGLPAGSSATCYVDADDPFEAVIERGFSGDYLFGLVPLLFTFIGIGGLVFAVGALRNAKRDSARPSWGEPSEPGGAAAFAWTSVGPAESAAAGPMLLEPATGPLGKLGCTTLAALFWNGFISIFVWHIVQDWRAGSPQWLPAVILAPFVLIGLLFLSGIPYSILALLNPRPRVHLDPAVLRAGGSAQLEWAFRGLGSRIRRLRIWLEATETTTRTGKSSVEVESRALDTPDIEILDSGRERPLEYGAVSFAVPGDTPLSSAGDVAIRWKLKLHGDIAYWPDVNEEYEVQVR